MLFICKADKKNLSLGICVCLSVCVRTENIFLYMVSVYVLWVYILMLVENRGKQIVLFICKLIKKTLASVYVSVCLCVFVLRIFSCLWYQCIYCGSIF